MGFLLMISTSISCEVMWFLCFNMWTGALLSRPTKSLKWLNLKRSEILHVK